MNGKQYKNIIDNTMKHIDNEIKSDSVKTAIEIFKNRGIEFPDESVEYVKEILSSDNYMSWEHCEVSDLHDYANNGVAVVGIDKDRIVVIAPESDDEAEEKYPNILTYLDLTEEDFENMTFYAATASYYGGGSTTPKPSPKIPTRIAQNGPLTDYPDPQWNGELWQYNGNDYSGIAEYGCSVACTSMALSCIGRNKTPGEIINTQGGDVVMNWTKFGTCTNINSSTAVADAVKKYKDNPDKYAPPIVQVKTSSTHYVVVCGYSDDGKYFMAVDPGYYGYDYKNKTERYYHWEPLSSQQAVQYSI